MLCQARTGEFPSKDNIEGMRVSLINLVKSQKQLTEEIREAGINQRSVEPKNHLDVLNFIFDKTLAQEFANGKTYITGENLNVSFKNNVFKNAKAIFGMSNSLISSQSMHKQIEKSNVVEINA